MSPTALAPAKATTSCLQVRTTPLPAADLIAAPRTPATGCLPHRTPRIEPHRQRLQCMRTDTPSRGLPASHLVSPQASFFSRPIPPTQTPLLGRIDRRARRWAGMPHLAMVCDNVAQRIHSVGPRPRPCEHHPSRSRLYAGCAHGRELGVKRMGKEGGNLGQACGRAGNALEDGVLRIESSLVLGSISHQPLLSCARVPPAPHVTHQLRRET